MAIWRSKTSKCKNVGDPEPLYPRETAVIRINYSFEVRQKLKDTLKNPPPFTGRPSYKDFKSHPDGPRGVGHLTLLHLALVFVILTYLHWSVVWFSRALAGVGISIRVWAALLAR